MKQLKFIFTFFLLFGLYAQAQTPERFKNHRVGKNETLNAIIEQYGISESQLLEYNPLVERVGIKRRMTLRIPIYAVGVQQDAVISKVSSSSAQEFIHLVAPKETKWRLAYQYGTTIATLDSLNPEIKEGLKIGQEIRIPSFAEAKAIPETDSLYNYYTVLPKEGFYRIEKKLGVNQQVLDSLNPDLAVTGRQPGMILKMFPP